jgi:hypothetical protein
MPSSTLDVSTFGFFPLLDTAFITLTFSSRGWRRTRCHFSVIEEMHRQAFGPMETALAKEHSGTLTSVNNLAKILTRQRKKEQAEEMHR